MRRTFLIALGSLLATASFVAASRPATAAAPVAHLARVHVRITTTSDWAQVRIGPGAVAASRVEGAEMLADGWSVHNAAGTTRIVEGDAVLAETTGASALTVTLVKGAAGSVTVHIDGAGDLVSAGDGAGTAAATVPRAALYTWPEPVLPHGDSRRLVLAFYYPWWGNGGPHESTDADRPSDPRSTADADGVTSLTRQAHDNGIDGFVVSWQGAVATGRAFANVLAAEDAVGGTAAPYLEMGAANLLGDPHAPADPAVVTTWLSEALDMAGHPAFLRSGGVPVVFVYSMSKLSPDQWRTVMATVTASGRRVRLVGDARLPDYGDAETGWHHYTANGDPAATASTYGKIATGLRAPALLDPTGPPPLFAATVSPGYDDHLLRGAQNPVVPRGDNGSRYDASWSAAVSADPDWILITSWNEWYEGTAVEPGVKNGDLALRQTAARAAAWKSAGAAPASPGTTAGPQPAPRRFVPLAATTPSLRGSEQPEGPAQTGSENDAVVSDGDSGDADRRPSPRLHATPDGDRATTDASAVSTDPEANAGSRDVATAGPRRHGELTIGVSAASARRSTAATAARLSVALTLLTALTFALSSLLKRRRRAVRF